jgi:hypothetical protein
MAAAATALPISAVRTVHSAGGTAIPIIRLWVKLAFACRSGGPLARLCLLDTGAPVSVIPFEIHSRLGLAWVPLAGTWPSGLTIWQGVPCTVGKIDVWVPLPEQPYFRGPLPLIGKFAQATPAHVPGAVPILLGLNFLDDHCADVFLRCHAPGAAGAIVLP